MLNDKNSYNYDNRNLSEVFKELQEIRQQGNSNQTHIKKGKKEKIKKNFNIFSSIPHRNNTTIKTNDLKLSHIITGCSILVVSIALFFPRDTAFSQSYARVEEKPQSISEYELNRHRLNVQNIISENADMDRVKEQVVEDRDVEFETNYNNNPSLPKGEENIIQEGVLGKDIVTAVKTYENGNFVEEIILSKEKLSDPTPKIIDLGTSEFLAKHKVHLGDVMYLVDTANLKETADENSKDLAEIKKSLDIKLLELPNEDWCKISFDGTEGYLKTSNLTSSYTTPNIVEKNRIQRILLKVNIDMELNRVSGLTLNDYKKIFTGPK